MANRSVERPSCRPLRVEIATCARGYEPSSALAYDTARLCLADSLACAFEALQPRACTRLLAWTSACARCRWASCTTR